MTPNHKTNQLPNENMHVHTHTQQRTHTNFLSAENAGTCLWCLRATLELIGSLSIIFVRLVRVSDLEVAYLGCTSKSIVRWRLILTAEWSCTTLAGNTPCFVNNVVFCTPDGHFWLSVRGILCIIARDDIVRRRLKWCFVTKWCCLLCTKDVVTLSCCLLLTFLGGCVLVVPWKAHFYVLVVV